MALPEFDVNAATLLQRKKKIVKFGETESLLMLRSYAVHPTNWGRILENIRQNIDQLPPDARELYKNGTLKQLRDRMSGKLGKLVVQQNIENREIRDAVEQIKSLERRLLRSRDHSPVADFRDNIAAEISESDEPQPVVQLHRIQDPALEAHRGPGPAVQVRVRADPAVQVPVRAGPAVQAPVPAGPAVQAPVRAGPAVQAPVRAGPAVQAPVRAGPAVQAPVRAGPAVQAPVPAGPAVQAPVPAGPAVQAPVPAGPAVQAPVRAGQAVQAPVRAGPAVQAPVPAGPAVQAPVPAGPAVQALAWHAQAVPGRRQRKRPLAELIRDNQERYNRFIKKKIPKLLRQLGVSSDSSDTN